MGMACQQIVENYHEGISIMEKCLDCHTGLYVERFTKIVSVVLDNRPIQILKSILVDDGSRSIREILRPVCSGR